MSVEREKMRSQGEEEEEEGEGGEGEGEGEEGEEEEELAKKMEGEPPWTRKKSEKCSILKGAWLLP